MGVPKAKCYLEAISYGVHGSHSKAIMYAQTDIPEPRRMKNEAESVATDDPQRVAANPTLWKLHGVCWFTLTTIAVVNAWFTRYEIGGDSMSYLDIARAIAEGHPGVAIHAYWSPGYPLLLSTFLWVFRPGPYWECPLAHFVNLLIFVGALTSFQLFWGEAWRWHLSYAKGHRREIPETAFWALGYSVFGIAILNVITIGLVGPDLLMAMFCCLAAWSALHLRRIQAAGHALALGVVLAIGYYVKAPFFPMGFIFILCACFEWPLSRRMLLHGATALAIFMLASAPFIAALSLMRGRLTFGDVARINQGFFINGVQFYEYWQGGPPGAGMPVHPTHKLNAYPEIYEFAEKNMGTYPPWFDPTYWYEGITPHTNWRRQAHVFRSNILWQEFDVVMEVGAGLVYVLILFILLTGRRMRWMKGFRRHWFIWLPAVMALAMFAAVHVERRFLGGWLVILFAGAISACSLPPAAGIRRVADCAAAAAAIATVATLVLQAGRQAIGSNYAAGRSVRQAAIAVFLLNNGLHTDDNVAIIGSGFYGYWAHLARLHIVAEIPGNDTSYPGHPTLDFWESGKEQQKKALDILERTGVKAIVSDPAYSVIGSVPSTIPQSWKNIDGTGTYVYFFHSAP
jgi:hypothetical protein